MKTKLTLALLIAVASTSRAQSVPALSGFCETVIGTKVLFTGVFTANCRNSSSIFCSDWDPLFAQFVSKQYAGAQQNLCFAYPTAEQAEAELQKQKDSYHRSNFGGEIELIDWAPKIEVKAPPKALASGQKGYMWCWAAQLRPDVDREKTFYSQIFPTPANAANIGNAFGTWVHKTYRYDFNATGIGNGECQSFVSEDAAKESEQQYIDEWNRHGQVFHPQMTMIAIPTIWRYGTTAWWDCGELKATYDEFEQAGENSYDVAISLRPDGSIDYFGIGILAAYWRPVLVKGGKEPAQWYRQPDGTIFLTMSVGQEKRTFYIKLRAGGRPPTGSFELDPPNAQLGNHKFPLECSALVWDRAPANPASN
jgi:hypothetical protein